MKRNYPIKVTVNGVIRKIGLCHKPLLLEDVNFRPNSALHQAKGKNDQRYTRTRRRGQKLTNPREFSMVLMLIL